MINIAIIGGRLTADCELKVTTTGKPVVSFCIAAPNGKDKEPNYIDCTAFENVAENFSKMVHKGDKVVVTGRISTRNYEDKNGNTRKATELRVKDFDLQTKRPQTTENAEDLPEI